MRLFDCVRAAERRLAAAGVDNPALDARLLAGHVLGLEAIQILSQAERRLADDEIASVEKLLARRAAREPVARILGVREFWSLPFGLNEATLEPRPDSETLIEAALKIGVKEDAKILDLGTGTGCLLLSLLHERPRATGLGLDIAPRAVEQARLNAARLGLQGRAEFRVNDWLAGIEEKFDVIISNPPYIVRGDIPALMPEVRDHDPARALDGGEDGLEAYGRLIPALPRILNEDGLAVFEIGDGQAAAVSDLFRRHGFRDVTMWRDLAGVERCITVQKQYS